MSTPNPRRTGMQHQPPQGVVSPITTADHPLASKPTEVKMNSAQQGASQIPTKNRSIGTFPTPPPRANIPSASPLQIMPNMSMEDMVNIFLSGPSFRTHELGLPPLLRPVPLRNEPPLQCLRTLVERRAWGDVLQIASEILHGSSSVHAPVYVSIINNSSPTVASQTPETRKLQDEIVEVMALQCHAWLKLRRYTDIIQEVEKWTFAAHKIGHKATESTWIPWSLHILAAESVQYSGDKPSKAADELFLVRDCIPEDEYRWKISVDRALANFFIRERQWRLALKSLERILDLLPGAVKKEIPNIIEEDTSLCNDKAFILVHSAYKCEILSVQGRILLQVGGIQAAAQLFEYATITWAEARKETPTEFSSPKLENYIAIQHIPAQLDVNDGLVHFAYHDYAQALECFNNATNRLRGVGGLGVRYRNEDYIGSTIIGVASHNELFNECINNMAICALHTCRLHDAENLMESLVREDPTAFLTERIAFNLCTLYELGADSAASIRKKRVLQFISKRFFLHDIGPESFRLN